MGRPWGGRGPTTPSTSTVSVTTPSTLPGFRCHCRSISGPRPWNSCRASSPTVCELVEGIVTVPHKAHAEVVERLERRQQVARAASKAIECPDQHAVDLVVPGGCHQGLELGAALPAA